MKTFINGLFFGICARSAFECFEKGHYIHFSIFLIVILLIILLTIKMNKNTFNSKEIYKHFKGNLYELLAIANHSETKEEYVVYKALYGNHEIWIRPSKMFFSKVDKEKYPNVKQEYRFEKISK